MSPISSGGAPRSATRSWRPGAARRSRQHGVVLIFALIALTLLLVGAVALVRSTNTTLFAAGNLALKQDLVNQGERAVPVVMNLLRVGALNTALARADNSAANNYSASMLPVDANGIPEILLASNADFAAAWQAADIEVTDASGRNQQVRVRYVVDRLCAVAGEETALGDQCIRARDPIRGGSSLDSRAADTTSAPPVVYRLSIRVDGPRGTQSFFQTTFSL